MRLLNRTLSTITIAPRITVTGGCGGIAEGFSAERIALRGNIGYVSNTLNSTANALISTPMGERIAQALKLRFMGDVPVNAGDGVILPGEDEPAWRCVEVNRFPLMTVARVEKIAGDML